MSGDDSAIERMGKETLAYSEFMTVFSALGSTFWLWTRLCEHSRRLSHRNWEMPNGHMERNWEKSAVRTGIGNLPVCRTDPPLFVRISLKDGPVLIPSLKGMGVNGNSSLWDGMTAWESVSENVESALFRRRARKARRRCG